MDELYTPFNNNITRTKRSVPPHPPIGSGPSSPPPPSPSIPNSIFLQCFKIIPKEEFVFSKETGLFDVTKPKT